MGDLIRIIWRISFGRLELQYIKQLGNHVGDDCSSLLDVGCGFNSPVRMLPHRPKRLVGVDGFQPVIEQSRQAEIHDEYIQSSILELDKCFEPSSFDCVLASDLIEHLTKEDGLKLLAQMETISKESVIIFTPNGFLPQGEEFGNPMQKHISGWTVKEMRDRGYKIIGIGGIKFLRGEMAKIRWRPRRFWLMVSLLSQFVTTKFPCLSFSILCVKGVSNKQS